MQAPFNHSQLTVYQEEPINAGTPLDLLRRSFLTPQNAFFLRTHGSIPHVDLDTYRLSVTGMVQNRLDIALEELRSQFPAHTVTATLVCAGSRRKELDALRPLRGELLWGPDPIGTAEWRGVLLRDVLQAVGVQTDAHHVAFTSLDEVQEEGKRIHFGSSITLEKALSSDALLAYEMNHEPLSSEHGFPLRVLVPGYVGVRSVKWLREITLQEKPSANYFQARDYKTFPPTVTADTADWNQGKTLEEIPLNAVISTPQEAETRQAGPNKIQGYAITGQGAPIERVELSIDKGMTWHPTTIVSRADPWAWCLWETTLDLAPGDYQLIVRAWDADGHTQPEDMGPLWNFKGYANNAWHRVNIHVI